MFPHEAYQLRAASLRLAVIDMARQVRQQQRISPGSAALCLGSLFLAALVHPLMAAYALGCVAVLGVASLTGRKMEWLAYGALCLVAIGAAVCLLRFTPAPPPDYIEVAKTRAYWFL